MCYSIPRVWKNAFIYFVFWYSLDRCVWLITSSNRHFHAVRKIPVLVIVAEPYNLYWTILMPLPLDITKGGYRNCSIPVPCHETSTVRFLDTRLFWWPRVTRQSSMGVSKHVIHKWPWPYLFPNQCLSWCLPIRFIVFACLYHDIPSHVDCVPAPVVRWPRILASVRKPVYHFSGHQQVFKSISLSLYRVAEVAGRSVHRNLAEAIVI